jgi:hypothetical protein
MLVALGLIVAAEAHAVTQPGKARLRAWTGFTTLSLDDINTKVRAERDAFRADTLVDESSWDPLGGAPSLGAELEVQITPVVSAGLGFSAHRSSVRHQATRIFSYDFDTGEPAEIETFDEELKVQAWDVVGTVGFWVPSAPGLHFGGQFGVVRGTIQRDAVYLIDTFSILPNMILTQGTWRGTGVVLGAFTGYEQSMTSQLALTTRIGYRYRKVGRPQGTEYLTEWGDQGNAREVEFGPLLDATGRPMSLDLGGFYFKLGVTMGLGGGD